VWIREITKSGASGNLKDSARIEVSAWVRRVTLDMIGHAGAFLKIQAPVAVNDVLRRIQLLL
jgi:hypothetical protein